MLRPLFLTRASIGLAATAVEQASTLPARAGEALGGLPGVPVRLAGGLVQSYMHAGQALTDLAVKGDRVLESLFPAHSDQPGWATFDEDEADPDEQLDVSYTVFGSTDQGSPDAPDDPDGDEPDVPSGRVGPRRR